MGGCSDWPVRKGAAQMFKRLIERLAYAGSP